MPAGGIEIILELKSIKKNNIPIIIITQYPDIEIENDYFSIIEAGEEISNAYGIIDISAVLYEESSDNWKNKTTEFLNKI
jgi:response regulator RpfG family c-di-GMP phosphodiesterase